MAESHTRQNQFHGHTGRHRSTIPKGGEKNVDRPIGGADCWCGQPYGHDWEGKDEGAPHPRGIDMNARAESSTKRITARDMKGWHRDVVDLVRELVNDYGVRFRGAGAKGGTTALLLYPMDGVSQPFRISTQRPKDETVKYLLGFAREFVPGFRAGEEKKVEEGAQRLAETLNGPEHPTTQKKSSQAEEPTKEERVSAMEIPAEARVVDATGRPNPNVGGTPIQEADVPGVTTEWTPYEGEDGYIGWSKALVSGHVEMRCDRCHEKGELWTTRYWPGMGGHGRKHGPTGTEARMREATRIRTAAEDAALALCEVLGLDITGGSAESEAEIAKLKETVAKRDKQIADLTAERDELLNWKSTIQGLLGK